MSPDELTAWLTRFAELVHEQKDELTALDSAIGDADHGSNMDRGMTAVVAALAEAPPADAAGVLKKTGAILVSKVGGASGPLYGTLFLRMAGAAEDGFAASLRAGFEGVLTRGKAEPGDKTMVDALGPACDVLDAGGSMADAAQAAAGGRDATVPLVARKGRASYLGERSAGHADPGATSTALLLQAAAETLGGIRGQGGVTT